MKLDKLDVAICEFLMSNEEASLIDIASCLDADKMLILTRLNDFEKFDIVKSHVVSINVLDNLKASLRLYHLNDCKFFTSF